MYIETKFKYITQDFRLTELQLVIQHPEHIDRYFLDTIYEVMRNAFNSYESVQRQCQKFKDDDVFTSCGMQIPLFGCLDTMTPEFIKEVENFNTSNILAKLHTPASATEDSITLAFSNIKFSFGEIRRDKSYLTFSCDSLNDVFFNFIIDTFFNLDIFQKELKQGASIDTAARSTIKTLVKSYKKGQEHAHVDN